MKNLVTLKNMQSDFEPTYINSVRTNFINELSKKIDGVIKTAIIKAGFNPDDIEFIKDNFQRIIKDGDIYEHFYYHFGLPDEIRIISIEKTPPFNDFQYIGNTYKMEMTYKYY